MSVEQLESKIDSVEGFPSVFADNGSATIEPVDKTVLTALAEAQEEDEPDLIVELIDLYLDDAPKLVGDIQRAAKGGDAVGIKRAAHALKGSSGSIGVSQVAELCKLFEQLNSAELDHRSELLLPLLVREFDRAREALLEERRRRIS